MRKLICAALCLLAPTYLESAEGTAQNTPASDLANRIVAEIFAAPFATSRKEWRQANPAAEWREFRGDPFWQGNREPFFLWPEGMWCVLAGDDKLGVERQAVFYAVRPHEPLDCRLEQLTFEASERTDGLYESLMETITRRVGNGQENRLRQYLPDIRRLRDAVSVVEWFHGTYRIFLFRSEGRVGVMARTQLLGEVLSQADHVDSLGGSFTTLDTVESRLEARHPAITALLRDESPDQPALVAAARRLLEEQRRATDREERAFLALAAEAVISRLDVDNAEPEPSKRPELAALAPFRLRFEYDGHSDRWNYAGELSEAVRRRYPDTTWGRQLQIGWVLSGGVTECMNSFEEVISLGRRWLERHPSSRYRLAVTVAVAKAYETWWSISMAPDHDELVEFDTDSAVAGAAAARLEAVRWYRRVLDEAPALWPMVQTERRLMHLRLGIDTAQRRYQCAIA